MPRQDHGFSTGGSRRTILKDCVPVGSKTTRRVTPRSCELTRQCPRVGKEMTRHYVDVSVPSLVSSMQPTEVAMLHLGDGRSLCRSKFWLRSMFAYALGIQPTSKAIHQPVWSKILHLRVVQGDVGGKQLTDIRVPSYQLQPRNVRRW